MSSTDKDNKSGNFPVANDGTGLAVVVWVPFPLQVDCDMVLMPVVAVRARSVV